MRRTLYLLPAAILLAVPGCKRRGPKAQVERATRALIRHCQKAQFKKAARYLACTGRYCKKRYRDPVDYDSRKGRLETLGVCGRINRITRGVSKRMVFEKYKTESESEGKWHVWTVAFRGPRGKKRRYAFAFLKIGSRFLLGDIDSVKR